VELKRYDRKLKHYTDQRLVRAPVHYPKKDCKESVFVNHETLKELVHHPDVIYFTVIPIIKLNDEEIYAVGMRSKRAGIKHLDIKYSVIY
jgi:hypothetical protein